MISDLKNNTAFHSLNISASGMMAQRRRLDAIAQNLANLETTRTAEGGPYKPKETIFAENPEKWQTQHAYASDHNELYDVPSGGATTAIFDKHVGFHPTKGLRYTYCWNASLAAAVADHPDADADGYVAYPDINLVEEISHLVLATRAYEANVTAIRAAKELAARGLEI